MDHEKIKKAVSLFLEGIGEDETREGLVETPERIANMCEEIFGGLHQEPKEHLERTFPSLRSDIVIERDITFYSVCEHHFLPFYGKAYIGYIPDGKVVGLSKLVRTIETYARRPQIQEQLTAEVARAIQTYLNPKGVIVLMEAEHMCMSMRGVKRPGTKTITYATEGVFRDNEELQALFMKMAKELV